MINPKEEARRIVNINWTFQIRTIKKPNWEHAKQIAIDIIEEKIKYHESLFDKGFKDIHIALSSPIKTYNDILNPLLNNLKEVRKEIEKL